MRKFKIGDRVRRISHAHRDIDIGDIGTVTYASEAGVFIVLLEYAEACYNATCFELAEEEEENSYGFSKDE